VKTHGKVELLMLFRESLSIAAASVAAAVWISARVGSGSIVELGPASFSAFTRASAGRRSTHPGASP